MNEPRQLVGVLLLWCAGFSNRKWRSIAADRPRLAYARATPLAAECQTS